MIALRLLSCWLCMAMSLQVMGANLRSSAVVDGGGADLVLSHGDQVFKRILNKQSDPLRRFIGNAVFKLPEDIKASEVIGFRTFDIEISEFRCFDISFANISIDSLEGRLEDFFQLEVTDFTFKCTFDMSWSYGWANGQGSVFVNSDKDYLTTQMPTGQLFNGQEEQTSLQTCQNTTIDIVNLIFEGDMSVRLLALFRGFISRIAENQLEKVFCEIISQHMLGPALDEVQRELNKYRQPLSASQTDPLQSSVQMQLEEGKIIGLQNDTEAGDLIKLALNNLNQVYATRRNDSRAITSDQMDYGINIILREKFLEEDGAFILIDESDEESISGGNALINVTATINSVKVYDLDKAIVLSPVSVIGNHTVQTELFWETIVVETNITVEARASSSSDSFYANPSELEPIVENVLVRAGAHNITASLSLIVPLERSVVEDLPLGYILNWKVHPACIPPVLFDMAVSGLAVRVENIDVPQFEGIVSQDIYQIVKKGAIIGLKSFESELLEAIPGFFQTEGRNVVNNMLGYYHCPAQETSKRRLKYSLSGISLRQLEAGPLVAEESLGELVEDGAFYVNLVSATVCVCIAALAAGLTMGLLSLDPVMLLIKQRAGSSEKEQKDAASLLPIVKQHHLLLVSLLLMNAAANEALPLFLDQLVPGYVAVVLSVTLVLFFGEIIPSAVFTGPDQISIASRLAPVVRVVMLILSPIAWPIAKVLDHVLHDEESGNLYNRGELSALVRIQYEERMASKRRRKIDMQHAFRDDESTHSSENYSNRGTSAASANPEITATLRAMKREMSQRNLMAHNDLHVDEVMMVEGALQMKTTAATEVFTPWNRVFTVPITMKLGERNIVKIYRSGFSRIPVYEKNPDDPDDNTRIRGILSSRQLMVVDSQHQRPVSTLPFAIPRCVAPETTLVDLINIFQTGGVQGSHLALVCARPNEGNEVLKKGKPLPEDVGLMGIVTLEDVLESLIQEQIYDEYDRQERERLRLARWGIQRWKMFVKNKKREQMDSSCQSLPENPEMRSVVEEATQAAEEGANEQTSLLGRLNPFK